MPTLGAPGGSLEIRRLQGRSVEGSLLGWWSNKNGEVVSLGACSRIEFIWIDGVWFLFNRTVICRCVALVESSNWFCAREVKWGWHRFTSSLCLGIPGFTWSCFCLRKKNKVVASLSFQKWFIALLTPHVVLRMQCCQARCPKKLVCQCKGIKWVASNELYGA